VDPPALAAVSRAPLDVLGVVAEARVVLVVGDTDTGKTTLVTALANHLRALGAAVGVVDADVGQSEIGPPTTIGLGRIVREIARLGDAELVAMHFVGSTSPPRNLAAAVEGARRMLERALAEGLAPVLVDTPGLVRGGLGLAYGARLVAALAPDVLTVIERDAECEALVGSAAGAGPRIVRVPALTGGRRRGRAERTRHRARALDRHFGGARHVDLDLRRVDVRGPGGVGPFALPDAVGRLAGLEDGAGEVLGLGVLTGVDPVACRLRLWTGVAAARVARVEIGRDRLRPPRPGARALDRRTLPA
jgi:polynucleotide 5'-kinase involved in rRNA processing